MQTVCEYRSVLLKHTLKSRSIASRGFLILVEQILRKQTYVTMYAFNYRTFITIKPMSLGVQQSGSFVVLKINLAVSSN